MEWLTDNKLPVGKGAEAVVNWLIANATWFFDGLENGLSVMVDAILAVLQFPPPLMGVAIITALAFVLHRSILFTIAMAVGLLFIVNQGYWEETTETLTLVLSSAFLCMVIGVPIGIYLAHHPRAFALARPILDLMQTLPTFVYLIPAII
ncbi:MAG: choline ABC transporter permease subunit, partial [Pseudomonadota bacterium]